MTTLTEFLNEVAKKRRTPAPEVEPIRRAWVESVNRLIRQCEEWLRKTDTENVLEITTEVEEIREELFGLYEVPSLTIRLGRQRVKVLPIGRDVQAYLGEYGKPSEAITGRVDITDGAVRFHLYRVEGAQGERWVAVDSFHRLPLRNFDKEVFESILLSILG